jgi:hypothetical protein
MARININNSELGDLFNLYSDTEESEKILFKLYLAGTTKRESSANIYHLLDKVRESNHISDLRNYRNLAHASSAGGQIQDALLENWCSENNQGSVIELFEFLIKDYEDQTFQLGNEFLDEIEFSYVASRVANSINGYAEYVAPLWDRLSEQEFEKDDSITMSEFINTIRTEAINNFYDPNLFAVRMNALLQKLREFGFEL